MKRYLKLGIMLMALSVAHPALAGNAARGKAKSATCVACHGTDGNSSMTSFPRLAGQHEDYLRYTLNAYKSGKRKNEVMKGIVASLSKEDMADLAAFYAGQRGLEIKR